MAQVSGVVHTSQVVGKKESIVDELFYLDPMDTPFLTKIGMGPNGPLNTLRRKCTNPTYQWPETALTTNRTTLTTGINNSVTAMVLDDAYWTRVGDVVLMDLELISIDALTSGQPTTITRGVYGSTAAAHVAGAVIVNTGIARAQGGDAPTDDFEDQPTLVTNYTQIWLETIRIAMTTQATESYGRTNEYDEAKAQKMRRIKEQLEHAVLFGGTPTAPVGSSTASRMGGALNYVTTNVRALSGAQLNISDIHAVMELCYNAGGAPDCLIVGSFNKRVISDWKMPHVQYQGVAESSSGFGATVGSLETDFGKIMVISKRSIPQSLCMLITSQNVGVGPLQGNNENREFTHKFLGETGDHVRGLISGEYTCEWRMEKSHGLITGTAVS